MQLLVALIAIAVFTIPNVIQLVRAERQLRAFSRAAAVFFEAIGRDSLTGLADRRGLHLAHIRFTMNGTPPGVLFLDLDAFKAINDTYGHDIGDDLLRTVAARLHATINAADGVAGRLGGDEFVALLPRAVTDAQLIDMAERIHAALADPIVIDGTTTPLAITCHIGAAAAGQTLHPGRPFRAADIALYHARHHRTPTAIFRPAMTVLSASERHGPRLRDYRPSPAGAVFDRRSWDRLLADGSATDSGPAEASADLRELAALIDPRGRAFGDDVRNLFAACLEHRIVTLAPAVSTITIEPTSLGEDRDGGLLVLVRLGTGITVASDRLDSNPYLDDPAPARQIIADIAATVTDLYGTYRSIDPASGAKRP